MGFGFHPDDSDRTHRPFRDRISSWGSSTAPGPSALPWTSEGVLIVDGAPPEVRASSPRTPIRDRCATLLGFLSSPTRCWPRARSRSTPAFAVCRVWSPSWRRCSCGPTRSDRSGSVPEVFLQRFPPTPMGARLRVPALLPLGRCFCSSIVPRLQGLVPDEGPLEPRGSPVLSWSSVLQGLPSRHPPQDLSALGPPARFPRLLPWEGDGRRPGVCSVPGSAFLSRGSVPSWTFEPRVLLLLLGSGASRDHGFSSAVPPLFREVSSLLRTALPTGVRQIGRAHV